MSTTRSTLGEICVMKNETSCALAYNGPSVTGRTWQAAATRRDRVRGSRVRVRVEVPSPVGHGRRRWVVVVMVWRRSGCKRERHTHRQRQDLGSDRVERSLRQLVEEAWARVHPCGNTTVGDATWASVRTWMYDV
jgi:hypothetical protein